MTTLTRSNWMLYGAYGATGRLILDEALLRGHRPVLAGRNSAQLSALGQETGLSTPHLPLDNGAALRAALSRVSCVLLAAGPYHLTGQPMRAACLDAGCSYLDINGEIEDFSAALACDAQARTSGVAIIPGVGYGVVFAECLAAQPGTAPARRDVALPFARHTNRSRQPGRETEHGRHDCRRRARNLPWLPAQTCAGLLQSGLRRVPMCPG